MPLPDEYQNGSIISAKDAAVLNIDQDARKIYVELGAHTVGVLAAEHLTDHPDQAAALFARLSVGDKSVAEGSLVLSSRWAWTKKDNTNKNSEEKEETEDEGRWELQLTQKGLLKEQHELKGGLPSAISELSPGNLVYGYVANISTHGAFVRFLGKTTALAPRANLSDKFVADPSEFFAFGQTVRARVVDIDADNGTAIVTLKPDLWGFRCGGVFRGTRRVEQSR